VRALLILAFAICTITDVSAQTITGKYLFAPMPEPGAWYKRTESGTGWFFDFQGPVVFGAGFGYETAGDSRFLTMSGVATFPTDPTGPTNQAPNTPIARLVSPAFKFADGQCHGCPYRAPVATQAYSDASLTWVGPRLLEFNAGGTTVQMTPFDTTPFDLAGDWQGVYHFVAGTEFTSRPIFRLTKRTDARVYHVDPNLAAGFEITLPTQGALEYSVQCIADCTNTFSPILPQPDVTWWVDPATGKGGIMYVISVNPAFFPTPFQIYKPNDGEQGRWSPQLWATRNRIVGRSYVPFLQPQQTDYIREIELTRMVPGQAAGLRLQ
jgi:hypothetical protein